MATYYLICASQDHVLKGIEGGFAQAGHGRKDLISKPKKGDWLVYYSSKDTFGNGKVFQKFTALGQFIDDEAYRADAGEGFKPYRRDVNYKDCRETGIRPLLESLTFIKNKKKWGFYLMNGFREIPKEDFELISGKMI